MPSRLAICSYCCRVCATSSEQPRVISCDEATRDANVSPDNGTISISQQQYACRLATTNSEMKNLHKQSKNSYISFLLFPSTPFPFQPPHPFPFPPFPSLSQRHLSETNGAKNTTCIPDSQLTSTQSVKNKPGKVTIGVPAQSTSIPVVCPLHIGVSRQTSAS